MIGHLRVSGSAFGSVALCRRLCTRESHDIVMSNTNRFVLLSRQLSRKIGLGSSYYEITAPVKSEEQPLSGDGAQTLSRSVVRSFDFQCTQHVLDNDAEIFIAAEFKIPASYGELRDSTGLSRAEHAARLSTLGPNAIPYRVSSWLELIGEEFSTYLYVYQFTFFSVWLWFSALVCLDF